jgi:two-component system chemotaxis sensor kinase CheA
MSKTLASIQLKVFGVIGALTLVIITSLATYFPARHIEAVRRSMEKKAETYARLVSRQVESGVAFDDRETVREVFAATAEDTDVRTLALYKQNGQLLHAIGELGPVPARPPVGTVRVETTLESIRAVAPVASKEGPSGTLLIELSTDGIEAERARIVRVAVYAGLGALALGFAAAWLIGRSLAKRLGVIARATQAVAGGDLAQRPIDDGSADEVGQLARAFNVMFSNIKSLLDQIRETGEKEKERLDGLVRKRTAELGARNDDMRLVLDHVSQGLFTVDRSGALSLERSRVIDTWLGAPKVGDTLWDYLGTVDPNVGASVRLSWSGLIDDFLPLELALDQMPHAIQRGGQHFHLDYQPILVDGGLSKVLVVISDLTSQFERDKADASQRELMTVFERVTKDRAGFLEFHAEADTLVQRIVHATKLTDVLKREIHTLKGNAAFFGVTRVAEHCHAMESNIAETGTAPGETERRELRERWNELSSKFSAFMGDASSRIEIEEGEYSGLLRGMMKGHPRQELARTLWLWRLEPTARRLDRFGAQARALATRLGKGDVRVVSEPNGLRLDARAWAPFWAAFVHVIRNAMDHGLESPEERLAANKPEKGILRITTKLTPGGDFAIEVVDDGRGIDWGKVAERAHALALPHELESDLERVLFLDGVSTKTEATEYSGRGVGMGALEAACQALGGRMRVRSRTGEGTLIGFQFPRAAMGDRFEATSVVQSVAPAA